MHRYRTVWMQYSEPDARTGRPMVKAIWPRHLPCRVGWDRSRRRLLLDGLLYLTFAAIFAAALLTSFQ